MALILPPPTTDTEREADSFLAKLGERVVLGPGTPLGQILQQSVALFRALTTPDRIRMCAGLRLVRYLPIAVAQHQYSTLVTYVCTPPDTISPNTLFLSIFYAGTLNSLWSLGVGNRPVTLTAFTDQARRIIQTITTNPGLPIPPLLPSDIYTIRAAYVGLVNRYYS